MKWLRRMIEILRPGQLPTVELQRAKERHSTVVERADRLVRLVDDYRRMDGVVRRHARR